MSDEPQPTEAPQQDEQPTNAIVVIREFNEDGGVSTKIVLSGDVKPTEVDTVLQLGLSGWRQQIGL